VKATSVKRWALVLVTVAVTVLGADGRVLASAPETPPTCPVVDVAALQIDESQPDSEVKCEPPFQSKH